NTVTQLTRETLEVIPTSAARTGLFSLLQQVPGVRSGIDVSSNVAGQSVAFTVFGQRSNPWQEIDGVVVKGPRAAEEGIMVDFMTFEEATLSTLGHDASVPLNGVNLVTVIRSGGNQFHGRVFYAATGSPLQSQGVTGGSSI